MQDRSGGVAHANNSDTCPGSASQSMIQEAMPDLSSKSENSNKANRGDNSMRESRSDTLPSRLIEFPGSARAVPAWRKQLSQRVREVQERKPRDAAEQL